MRKRLLAAALAFTLTAASLVGCGGGSADETANTGSTSNVAENTESTDSTGTEAESSDTAQGGTFVVPINATSIDSLTPYNIFGSDDGAMAANPCFDPLFVVYGDETRWYLAESLEATSEDACHYELKLRDGMKWHDGEAITADDMIYTYNMLMDTGNLGRVSNYLSYDGNYPTVEKVDDLTVAITLVQPFSGFETLFGRIRLLPEHVFGGETCIKDMTEELNMAIGSGPFKLAKYNEGDSIVYERYDDYYREPAKLDQVIIKLMPDLNAQEAAFQAGEISVMRVTNQIKLNKYKEDDTYTVYSIPEARLNYLAFNYQSEIIKNEDARKAICLALNADEIITGAYGSEEMALPAKNFCSPQNTYYNDEMEGYKQNLEEAKALAEKSGLTNTTLKYIYFTQRPNMKETAQIVQQQLAQIGVNVEITGYDNGEFFSHIFAAWLSGETVEDTSWDLASNGMDSLNADPSTKMVDYKGELVQNGFYASEKTLDLWIKATQAPTTEERETYFKELQVSMSDDYTMYPMANTNYVMVARKEFKGLDAVSSYPIFEDYTKIYME